jgi:NTP pyrophosphatase (non-canonical NTP hydrolase)
MSEELRPEVERFAMGMERKLRQNDFKGGWKQMTVDEMLERLDEEVEELKKALHPMRKENPQRVFKEAVDVANFCLFIADNAGALKDDE